MNANLFLVSVWIGRSGFGTNAGRFIVCAEDMQAAQKEAREHNERLFNMATRIVTRPLQCNCVDINKLPVG